MIGPITPAASSVGGPSPIPLNDAVQVHGATLQSREELRAERVSAEADEAAFRDSVQVSSKAPSSRGRRAESAPAESPASTGVPSSGSREAGRSSYRAEDTTGRPPRPGQDGSEEARDAALAQHAAEQQGIVELQRGDGERKHRSTRDMMGRLEGLERASTSAPGGPPRESAAAPSLSTHSAEGAASPRASSDAAPAAGGHGSAASHAPHAGSAASAGLALPQVTGELLGAAVASGATQIEVPEAGTAQAADEKDDEGQQEDSSQQAVTFAVDDSPVQVARQRQLGAEVGLGGEGTGFEQDREDGERRAGGHLGGGQGRGEEEEGEGQPPPPPIAGPSEAETPPAVVASEGGMAPSSASHEAGAVSLPEPLAEPSRSASPAGWAAEPALAQPVPSGRGDDGLASSPLDGLVGASPRDSSSLLVQEYFFFDDARLEAG